MKDLKKEITILRTDYEDLKKSFDFDGKKTEFLDLEAKTTDPELWDDHKNATRLMQDFSDLKEEIESMHKLDRDIETLEDFISAGGLSGEVEEELKKTSDALERLITKSYLSGPYDKKNAILSIHAGQGGTEAMDWASMLYRMYLRYCEKRGWKTQVLDLSAGEEAGIKSVSFKVGGTNVYGYLKGEVGTHRLVRQSPFNADRLRQTSFASVEVLPELAEVDLPDIVIKEEDLDWQFFRASGQGGQNVQKVSTAVRLKHIPTGVVVTSQTQRYQEQNRKYALDHLRAKLWAREQAMHEAKIDKIKGEYRPPSWGTQIRSYVLHPYKMVKDLRTEVESSNPESVLNGNLDKFIEAELKLPN